MARGTFHRHWYILLAQKIYQRFRNLTKVIIPILIRKLLMTTRDRTWFHNNEITYDTIMKIGKGKAYQKRHNYELQFRALASTTQAPIMEKVATFDTAMNKTFDGGYQALIHWYNQRST
jgi:hypothetical protein